jgi:aspartyl-tRNA(Asn)/glutamyl-tRNA(Gln) amidotransferase subunit B
LGVSDVNMEEGSLRCDANVSIRPEGSKELGTKTELKNMNSFRFLERGINAEIERQTAIVSGGGEVEQETLHFDPASGALSSLRSKEEAHDYRYFPEPDLVPVVPTKEMLDRAREALPELPAARAERFETELGLPADTAKLLAFRGEAGDHFEEALAAGDGVDAKALANWLTQETDAVSVEPASLAQLVKMVGDKTVSAGAARQVLGVLAKEGGDPAEIVEREGLSAQGADELGDIVDKAIADNQDAVEKIKSGKPQAIGAIVGAVMRETKGRADGGEVQRLIAEKLGS